MGPRGCNLEGDYGVVKEDNTSKRRNNDKWWIQWGFKFIWAIVPARMAVTVYVITLAHNAESNAKAYADRQDEKIVQKISENYKEVKEDLHRIEKKIDKNQEMIIEEIRRNGK